MSDDNPLGVRTAVYRFFDKCGALLYVGMTDNPRRRFSAHTEKPWWGQVDAARTTVAWYSTRELAAAAEHGAICAEKPLHNVMHLLTDEQDAMVADVLRARAEARAERVRAWESVRRAREGGVPDTVLCAGTQISRSTLNRVLGPRKVDEQEAATDE